MSIPGIPAIPEPADGDGVPECETSAGGAALACVAAAPTSAKPSARLDTARKRARIFVSFRGSGAVRICTARHARHVTVVDPVQLNLNESRSEPGRCPARVGADSRQLAYPKETAMRTPRIVLGVALIAGLAACGSTTAPTHQGSQPAADQSVVRVEINQSSLGPILTDQNGRTLYAFTNDKDGNSNCTGQCIATWPALISRQAATAGSGTDKTLLAQTTRAEGTAQATYGNWPLYYYVGDVGAGDVDGQGVDGVWFVVGADGKLIKTNP
jgi:predicted lipoprotein with Yx(FWY)xxD motif